jgi:hypothetical protein
MPKIYATATPAGCQPWCSPKHHQVCNGPVCSPHLHRDVTPDPQPYRDDMFVSVCSCGAEFLGDDPDDADYRLDCHMRGDHPCGCPNDVITSALRDGGEQCSRCGSTWDRDDQIVIRRGEDLPRVGRREHA